jgi:uncharacterized protein with HEPN domain
MELKIKTWLKDIEQSIKEIDEFIKECKDFIDFQKDIKTRKAVERNIEIIGEAIHRILKEKPDIKISDTRKIIDTRNRIIHGYDSISADILWLIVTEELVILKKEVNSLL